MFLYKQKCPLQQENGSCPPEEIQIDSDDDVGSIAEPLVVLSSTGSVEEEDVSNYHLIF